MDLADRLLPAFDTHTGIPVGAVHLLTGVQADETTAAGVQLSVTTEAHPRHHVPGDVPNRFGALRNLLRDASTRTGKELVVQAGRHLDERR